MYVQVIAYVVLASTQLMLALQTDFLVSLILSIIVYILAAVLLIKILRKNNQLEITDDQIKLNNVEVQLQKIEKIVIQGYLVQSMGIKLCGKKYIPNDLHFRFKNEEEKNVEEIKKWADLNGIKVATGRIKRWV